MDEGLERHLERVEESLEAIRLNTRTTWQQLLLAGILRGTGLIIGAALTVAIAGWGLGILGFIPGAEEISDYLSDIIEDVTNAT